MNTYNMQIAHRNTDRNTEHIANLHGYTPITADSIKRVPCTQISQDPALNNLIRRIHQDILEKAMLRSDGQRYDEVGYLLELIPPYRNTDAIYGAYDSDMGTSRINPNTNKGYEQFILTHKINQLMFMHNHPNNSPLSFGDIWNLVITDQIYAVTAVGNNGSVHAAYKDSNFNRLDMKKRFRGFNIALATVDDTEKNRRIGLLISRLMQGQDKYGIVFKYSNRR